MAASMYGDTQSAGKQASSGIQTAGEGNATAPGGSAWHEGRRLDRLAQQENERYMGGARGMSGSYGLDTGDHPNRQVAAHSFFNDEQEGI